ncbi:hypothetical protein K523DRAFT_107896 [Schizophyllum commune Tattone D]|nr:hypothetical protein K523DRAFT_107896 [Schizophyllum commune Tattone D]
MRCTALARFAFPPILLATGYPQPVSFLPSAPLTLSGRTGLAPGIHLCAQACPQRSAEAWYRRGGGGVSPQLWSVSGARVPRPSDTTTTGHVASGVAKAKVRGATVTLTSASGSPCLREYNGAQPRTECLEVPAVRTWLSFSVPRASATSYLRPSCASYIEPCWPSYLALGWPSPAAVLIRAMVARAPHPTASICQDCLGWPCPLSDTFTRTYRSCHSAPIPCLPAGLTFRLRHSSSFATRLRSGTHRQLRKPRVSTLHEFGLFFT